MRRMGETPMLRRRSDLKREEGAEVEDLNIIEFAQVQGSELIAGFEAGGPAAGVVTQPHEGADGVAGRDVVAEGVEVADHDAHADARLDVELVAQGLAPGDQGFGGDDE